MNERQRIAEKRKILRKGNRNYPAQLVPVPPEQWPNLDSIPARVLRSRNFLVQEYLESDGVIRLSVCRTEINPDGSWREDISWEELHRLKMEAGYPSRWAVEIFPPESSIVNVANLRHLWLLESAPSYAWKKPA